MKFEGFSLRKPPALPPQLEWKFADEPELLGWTIRARDCNTFVANCMFAGSTMIILAWVYFLYRSPPPGESHLSPILMSVAFYMVTTGGLVSITHQTMNFAYRFTESGFEHCKWKDFPQWALTFLKWFTPFTVLLFICLAALDPAFLLGALVGPGGLGLMYLSMANSKSFRELQTYYHHHAYEWHEITQLAIATNREVVDLQYRMILDGWDHETTWSVNVFCKRKQKEQVAAFIKPYLSPGVPFIRARVDVPNSTEEPTQ